jgi:hypothetical protein
LACFPSSGHNRQRPRIASVVLLGVLFVSGCSSHVPPFASVPYQRFSRAAVVSVALREWRLFGAQVNDDDHLNWDKAERAEGLWQRVGEYWSVGMNPGSPESRWTGKHDEHGNEFSPEDDGRFAWSAAFVSYVMRIAAAGPAFPYSPDHATYINAAKRMTLGTDHGWLITAERPEAYAPVPGDLICHGRDQASSVRYNNLPTAGLFPSHCDIVVDTSRTGLVPPVIPGVPPRPMPPVIPPVISVVGGNVQDTVTMRHVPVTEDGKLARPDGSVVDPQQPWMVVLRVHE